MECGKLELARFLPRPPLYHDLGFRIELHAIFSLRVQNPEEAFLPAVKREISHGSRDTDVDADVPRRSFVAELPCGSAASGEKRSLIAVWAFANELDGFIDRVGMNQAQHRAKDFRVGQRTGSGHT